MSARFLGSDGENAITFRRKAVWLELGTVLTAEGSVLDATPGAGSSFCATSVVRNISKNHTLRPGVLFFSLKMGFCQRAPVQAGER